MSTEAFEKWIVQDANESSLKTGYGQPMGVGGVKALMEHPAAGPMLKNRLKDFNAGWSARALSDSQPQGKETCPVGHPKWALTNELRVELLTDGKAKVGKICSLCRSAEDAREKALVEAAKVMCATCRNEHFPVKNTDGMYMHLNGTAICGANRIHQLRSRKETP